MVVRPDSFVAQHLSAIFGIFHLDDQPVDSTTLQARQTAMPYWGPDAVKITGLMMSLHICSDDMRPRSR
jgi:hypothetical protein